MNTTIRTMTTGDLPAVKDVIDDSELFPSELLDDMTAGYLAGEAEQEVWLVATENDLVVGVAFYAPEPMTDGTYNLYLIAVCKDRQGKGVGSRLMRHVEKTLRASGQRILLVETSGNPEFELTRKFYDQLGYEREARIRAFYRAGEDKVVFWKKL